MSDLANVGASTTWLRGRKFRALGLSSFFLLSTNPVLANGPVGGWAGPVGVMPPVAGHQLPSMQGAGGEHVYGFNQGGPTPFSAAHSLTAPAAIYKWNHSLSVPNSTGNGTKRTAGSLNQELPQANGALSVALANGVNLDLTSSSTIVTLGNSLISDGGSVSINVGGSPKSFQAGAQVTAAEYIAIIQVESGGKQTLVLDGTGRAIGGSVNLNALEAPGQSLKAGELVIASGVTAIDNAGKSGSLSISGDLINYGSLDVISSSSKSQSAQINALDVTNESGGLISSSSSLRGNAASSINLSLTASDNFTNDGTIVSSGALSVTAGGATSNGAGSSTKAVGDVNLSLGNGNLVNAGLVQSSSGNINISAPSSTDINISANGGTFSAASAINMREAAYTGSNNTVVNGGNWLSQQFNFNAGSGSVTAYVQNATGVVNVTAGEAHVEASTPNLKLGTMDITGDPTFYNTDGSVTLTTPTSVTGDLAIVASQDVNVAGLTSAPSGSPTGALTIIAGANFVPPPPTVNVQIGPDSSTTLTINGGSATGGIVQAFGPITTNGGNLVIAAYHGTETGSGAITVGGAINTGGGSSANNGNVTILAGAPSGTGISTGNITTSGAGNFGNAGQISLATTQPVINGSGQITIFDGTVFVGSSFVAGALTNSTISTGSLLAAGAGASAEGAAGSNGAAISLQSAGNITVNGSIRSYGGGGAGNSAISGGTGDGGNGASINVNSTGGTIAIAGDVNASGGGGGGSGGGIPSTGGSSGSITISASGPVFIDGPLLAAGGGGGGTSNNQNGGAGGGGSFGGGGGGSGASTTAPQGLAGGGGGGGFASGGGGGGIGANATQAAGSGGGGGYAGGGGGGAGAGLTHGPTTGQGGGGGGGGIGTGGGGGGGASAGTLANGGSGGAGGSNGAGQAGGVTNGQGGSGSGGGGSGGNSNSPANFGGNGGAGGGAGTGSGAGGIGTGLGNGGSAGQFGQGGQPSAHSFATAGDNAGGTGPNDGAGGTISITAQGQEYIGSTIASLSMATGSVGFTGLAYSGDSINATGASGSVTNSFASPSFGTPPFLQDANLAQGASTYLVPAGGQNIAGNIRDASSLQAGPITSGGLAPQMITEGTSMVTIAPGSFVTPAEADLYIQTVLGLSPQLVLSQPAVTTNPGTGFASGGTLNVATANYPAGGFTNLNVPAGVTMNVGASTLTVSNSATINGTLNFSGSSGITVSNSATINGALNFTGSSGALQSGSAIAGTGMITTSGALLSLTAANGSIGGPSGSPLLVQTVGQLGLNLFASATNGSINLVDSSAESIALSNGVNPLTATSSFSLQASGNIVAVSAGTTAIASPSVSLTAIGGNISGDGTQFGAPLLVNNNGGGLTLSANATTVAAAGGAINLSDTVNELVTLPNAGMSAGSSFALTAAGIASTAATAITAPTVILIGTSASSNIGTSSTTGTVNVSAPTLTVSSGGSAWVTDSAGSGAASTVTLVSATINGTNYNNGANTITGTYSITASNASLTMGAATVTADSVALTSTPGSLTVSGGNIVATDITLNSPVGLLTISDNNLTAIPDASGNGGIITINAGDIAIAGVVTFLNANGTGSGNGGQIYITTNDPSTGYVVDSVTGGIVMNATSGASGGNGGFVSFNSAQNLTFSVNGVDADPSTSGNGAHVTMIAAPYDPVAGTGGTLSLFQSSFTYNGVGNGMANGGQIDFEADSLKAGATLTLTANGSGTGDGGKITVNISDVLTELWVGSGAPAKFIGLMLNAVSGVNGGNGGIVSVTSGDELQIFPNGINAGPQSAGNGAHVTMIAQGQNSDGLTIVAGTYAYNGAGANGQGGVIDFEGATVNAITGLSSVILNANGAGTGGGGTVKLISYTASDFTLDAATGATISATGGSIASGGSIAGDGGSVTVSTLGTLSVNPAAITAGPLGQNGSGAQIFLTGSTVSPTSGTTLALNANGGGLMMTGTGNGGTVSITETTATPTPQSIGTTGTFNISVDVGEGGGNGGIISVTTGGALSVNPTGIEINGACPGGFLGTASGGSITLISGGNLAISGPLSANSAGQNAGTIGGLIELQSSSKTVFTIGSTKPVNGVGTLSVTGPGLATAGTIEITNEGGGITDSQTGLTGVSVQLTTGNNGTITLSGTLGTTLAPIPSLVLNASGSGKISGAKAIEATTISATSGTGAISLTGLDQVGGVSADTSATSTTGTVTLTSINKNTNTLDINSATGKTVTIKTLGNLDTVGPIDGGTVTLTATNKDASTAVSINGNVTATSGLITITAPTINDAGTTTGATGVKETASLGALDITADMTTSLTSGTVSLAATAGAVSATNADISAGKSITVTASKGAVTIDTIGVQNTTKSLSAVRTVSLSAASNITLGGSVSALTSIALKTSGTTSSIDLGNGEIYASGASITAGTGVVAITAGSGGISATSGSDLSGTKSVTLTSTKGSLDIWGTGGETSATGPVKLTALNSITSGGNLKGTSVTLSQTLKTTTNGTGIDINSAEATNGSISAIAAGALLEVNDSTNFATISATGTTNKTSTITLENSNITTGANGTIEIGTGGSGQGVNISTDALAGGKGNVYIVMGTPPSRGVNTDNTGGFNVTTLTTVFFGTNNITAGTNPGKVTLTGTNANVIFSTGKLMASAITVNAGTTNGTSITADPPPFIHSDLPASVSGKLSGDEQFGSQQEGTAGQGIQLAFSGQNNSLAAAPGDTTGSEQLNAIVASINNVAVLSTVISSNTAIAFPAASTSDQTSVTTSSCLSAPLTSNMQSVSNGSRTLYGALEDNSYIISEEGPSNQSNAAFCSDAEFGLEGTSIRTLQHKERMEVKNGPVVIAPNRDTQVETPFGTVHVGANSVVLIAASSASLSVYDLLDNKRAAVSIEAHGHKVELSPGSHITITPKDSGDFALVNAFGAIPHRNLRSKELECRDFGKNVKIYTSQFSVPAAILAITPLHSMVYSQHDQAKRLTGRLFKTAAILQVLNGANGSGTSAYQHYFRPILTAMTR